MTKRTMANIIKAAFLRMANQNLPGFVTHTSRSVSLP